ncbi:hydantoinase/oxoprolinase family protein [Paradesulfitobacterium ferrireducens]|uniref:hydantoinase/oxoprolinase family protein n=1 Tax=Paradesulfitobacterium ferrireducens TaxID=2816476 RepID=UPI001A8E73EE|nr:hydantoinase/oxoprolinase family protein [Paradesulfitobacterium ferrireducens]
MNKLTLGIDTGGTYTDGVLLDPASGEIKGKAKAFTTREDLSIGIRECIDNLGSDELSKVGLVALSTTLATNAVVEGKGCRVGLVLIGHEAIGNVPAHMTAVVSGGHNVHGQEQAELDLAALSEALTNMKGKVEAIAVSGYLSIRNPEHELIARKLVQELLDLPVICAHQLTTELGFQERTVTACLNARLLTVIAELLMSVRTVLKERGILAPMMVVKGDGSLMSEEVAREKPIETILSGPAASIVGAAFLTESEHALVLDMGGTTTDLAVLEDGRPRLKKEGAVVGGWRTRVEAAAISTFGLGGDSYIQVSADSKLQIGPKRVWPVSVMAARYPYLTRELMEVNPQGVILNGQPVDSWFLLKPPIDLNSLSKQELEIIHALQDGPHNIFTLAERTGIHEGFLPMGGLEDSQIAGRISFTPTDTLHALKRFTAWDVEAATACAHILAKRMKLDTEEFLLAILQRVKDTLSIDILQSLITYEGREINLEKNEGAGLFLERFLSGAAKGRFGVQVNLDLPIVAIGAPVKSYLPPVGQAFHTDLLIPTHAEVANAVGAAVGKVVETIHFVIRPGAKTGFIIHAPWGMEGFVDLEEAENYALEKTRGIILENVYRSGARAPEIVTDKEEVYIETPLGKVFIETRFALTAIGRPYWGE